MEINGNTDYFAIHPPRLEDAGLEEPALPVEGIQEAFRRAAEIVMSKGSDLLPTAKGCTEVPGSSGDDVGDAIVDPSTVEEDHKSCVGPNVDTETVAPSRDLVSPMGSMAEDAIIEGKNVGLQGEEDTCLVGEKNSENSYVADYTSRD